MLRRPLSYRIRYGVSAFLSVAAGRLRCGNSPSKEAKPFGPANVRPRKWVWIHVGRPSASQLPLHAVLTQAVRSSSGTTVLPSRGTNRLNHLGGLSGRKPAFPCGGPRRPSTAARRMSARLMDHPHGKCNNNHAAQDGNDGRFNNT
ncbi:hypothetical protein K456DRAFT_1664023 [Colletotrichum gloeosporioides 23]|nr:hypothetical protein K456DRAFT_1664023 [Colletotrichum gloeosporioides 23]